MVREGEGKWKTGLGSWEAGADRHTDTTFDSLACPDPLLQRVTGSSLLKISLTRNLSRF